jgi:hypothetical protein
MHHLSVDNHLYGSKVLILDAFQGDLFQGFVSLLRSVYRQLALVVIICTANMCRVYTMEMSLCQPMVSSSILVALHESYSWWQNIVRYHVYGVTPAYLYSAYKHVPRTSWEG